MYTNEEKRDAKRRWRKAIFGKIPYIIVGYFFYPFIQRSKVREKIYSDDYQENWWTRQLWFMMNDDEWLKITYDDKIDWNVEMVYNQGIDCSTKWGRFKASYWFNPWRNPASNYMFYHGPIDPQGEYTNQEVEIDMIQDWNFNRVDPMERAEWRWMDATGKESNRGEFIYLAKSKIGEGLVWYNPNGDEDVVDFRYSRAFKKKLFKWRFYITLQYGAWGDKYDLIFKIQKV